MMKKNVVRAAILTAGILIVAVVAVPYVNGGIPFVAIEKAPWAISTVRTQHPLQLSAADFVEARLTAADVSDRNARFVADPFLLKDSGCWYLFFEVLDEDTGQGDIAVATSDHGLEWTYQRIVLDEAFHLSFPAVFKADGEIYMLPETYQTKQIRLYRAENFPSKWVLDRVLIEGKGFLDSSIFQRNDRWWLLTSLYEESSRALHLYSAESLVGKWEQHPASPVITDNRHTARLAGAVKTLDDRLVRFSQDIEPDYGQSVTAHEIDVLSPTSYGENDMLGRLLVGPSGSGWNAEKMHHFHPARTESGDWLIASDGVASDRIVFGWDK